MFNELCGELTMNNSSSDWSYSPPAVGR